jgi:hypothetical protein
MTLGDMANFTLTNGQAQRSYPSMIKSEEFHLQE